MEKGILVIVSGFSGAGKGTVTKALAARYECYALSVSATSRAPRVGELEGREYFFKTEEEFEQMIAKDAFIEYARYVGHYYGTPKEYVQTKLEQGKDVILEIEVQGALQVKEQFPDAVTIFMTTPDASVLKKRLIGRGTETLDVVEMRMKRAAEEAVFMPQYDYIVVNDSLEECVANLHELLQKQHCRASHKKEFIETIRRELEEI